MNEDADRNLRVRNCLWRYLTAALALFSSGVGNVQGYFAGQRNCNPRIHQIFAAFRQEKELKEESELHGKEASKYERDYFI